LRLMPVSTLLRPLLRTARDIAHELKKPIEVELLGEEVELDRAILEKIKSPLTHLLRNAIDHGIEEPEERQRKKKSEVGKITINVIEEGSEIRIAITDDGGGVDLNQVVEKALNKQLILKEDVEKLSRENILDLLFMPGFSTKNMITDISGRGVGLDVVRTNLQMVKGKVNIDTEEGVSTTITMSFPLTVATDQGILVRVSGQLFIIPTQTVTRIINLKSVGTQAIEGCLSTNLEGQPIPLYYLADILQLQGSRSKIEVDSDMLALVISRGRSTVAFIIDEIIGEREIAIKALMQPLTKSKFITGATISGRGDVILVLHSGDLVDIALESNTGQLSKDSKLEEQTAPNVLLVEDSISTRTLEESIFKNRGYEVTSVVNGSEAWGLLQEKNFDIVVTDVEMPVMNGFELTEKIKNDKRLKDIPVLMVTSLSTEEDKKRGVKAGADAYISKGKFEAAGLLKIVEQLL
ncbi:MAG: response regulator, partial [Gammaproteobacteria bacterium]|nr:response regulator [Gammaproteobacteria bacterium]